MSFRKRLSTVPEYVDDAKRVFNGVTTVAGGGTSILQAIPVPVNSQVILRYKAVAYDATAGHNAYYERVVVAKNTAGTTTLVGSEVAVATAEQDATWNIAASANNTDDTLDITATADGSNDTTFRLEGSYEVLTLALN